MYVFKVGAHEGDDEERIEGVDELKDEVLGDEGVLVRG